jgi:hypothetical protein
LLCERFHQLETDAIQSIKEQQFLQEDSEVHTQPQSNSSKKGKKKKKNKKKKKTGNNNKNGSLDKISADVESSSDGEDDENDSNCTSFNLQSAVAVAPSSTGDSSNNKTSANSTLGTSDGGEFSQDIENIRITVPGLVNAWKSSEKDRLMTFWVTAPRARKEAILRQACP